jgi:hypothetical protein
MRRAIVATDVRLDLDDPPDATPGRVVADEMRSDKPACGLERRSRQEGPVEDAQRLR